MHDFVYVDTAGRWPRRFRLMGRRRIQARGGRVGFRWDVLSRHFTYKGAQKAQRRHRGSH